MAFSSNVIALDIEVASTCNAACPVCIRRSNGTINDFSQEMRTLSDIKRILGDIIHQIESVQFCGNYGDPMTCAEIHDISEWIKSYGNSTGIRISTNGGIGKPETYCKLGQLGVEIVWGIDGASKETNQLHRVHVDFNRVMENMDAYFSDIKPGTFSEWQYILWRENQHEVLPAINLAEKKGISNFFIRYPNGPTPEMPVVPVFDFHGGFTHWLQKPTDETKFLWDKSFRLDIPLPETTEHEQCVMDLVDLALTKRDPVREPINVNGYTHGIPEKIAFDGTLFPYPENFPYKEHFNSDEISLMNNLDYQTCFSKNYKNPNDVSENNHYLFISYDNYVYPCCMIGSSVSMAKAKNYSGNAPHINSLLNIIHPNRYDDLSVKTKSLKQVVDSGIIHELFYDDIENKSSCGFCMLTCGRQKENRNPYQVVDIR